MRGTERGPKRRARLTSAYELAPLPVRSNATSMSAEQNVWMRGAVSSADTDANPPTANGARRSRPVAETAAAKDADDTTEPPHPTPERAPNVMELSALSLLMLASGSCRRCPTPASLPSWWSR